MDKQRGGWILFWDDEWLRKCWWITLIFFGVTLLLTGFIFGKLPPEIPLFYSQPTGYQQLARREWIWLLPGLSMGGVVVFSIIMMVFSKEEKVLARLMAGFLVLLSLLFLISLIHILWLVL